MRSIVVSGSSSGIGDAIARRQLDDGWRVVGLDRALPVGASLARQDGVPKRDTQSEFVSFGSCTKMVKYSQTFVHLGAFRSEDYLARYRRPA